MTLSLCMIVRNEEKTLERCLTSVNGCFDEIIIVDTGSCDNTIAIAEKFTTQIYRFDWCNDFSAARNLSFSKAKCDYIMWLDADDILNSENKSALINLKRNLNGDISVYMLPYATAFDEENKPTFVFYRERIVKRNSFPIWRGRVHETIECSGKRDDVDIFVYHKSIKKTYSKRNLIILEEQLKCDGYLPPREQFYYGRELFYHQKYTEAARVFSVYILSAAGYLENRLDAYLFLSKCKEYSGDINEALKVLFCSFAECLPRANICCEIARLFSIKKDWHQAIHWYKTALDGCEKPSKGAFVHSDCFKYIPCLGLCVCYDKIGCYDKAEYYNTLASHVHPRAEAILHNNQYFMNRELNKQS